MKNPTFVRQLEAAKKYLWDGVGGCTGKGRYICLCLCDVSFKTDKSTSELTALIQERLGEHYTIENWLNSNGVPYSKQTSKKVQAHRLAWINNLIQEFS